MRRFTTVTAAVALLGTATIASAEIERAYNMTGITITDGGFVYGIVGNYPDLAGLPIKRIGVRNLEGEFQGDSVLCSDVQCD